LELAEMPKHTFQYPKVVPVPAPTPVQAPAAAAPLPARP